MNFDGHFIRNGVKLMATSHFRMFNHVAEPEHIGHYPGSATRVKNLALNDFRNAMLYYSVTDMFPDCFGKEWKLESEFMECQGNLGVFHDNQVTREPIFA